MSNRKDLHRAGQRGAALAEFALIFPVLALLLFAVLEIGAFLWQYQQGSIAAQRGLRVAVTRDLISPGTIPDCGPGVASPPGTLCSAIPNYDTWLTCDGSGARVGGTATGGLCGPDIADVADEIQAFYPRVSDDGIIIDMSGGGLGFVGLAKPVPMVTVRLTNVQHRFFVLSTIGLGPISMPEFTASAAAEDLTNG